MSEGFFFDTYALIEISKGNPNYDDFKGKVNMMLNSLNLLEYAYYLLRENKENKIKETFEQLSKFSVEYDNDILTKAARMKFRYKQEKLSFVDCIGYQLAKKYCFKFLTGDSKFKGKENVEFVE